MMQLRGAVRGRGVETLLVKLALSLGMILWMFMVATLSYA